MRKTKFPSTDLDYLNEDLNPINLYYLNLLKKSFNNELDYKDDTIKHPKPQITIFKISVVDLNK